MAPMAVALTTRFRALARDALRANEWLDLLLFGVAVALVTLPVIPDRAFGPFGGINPLRVSRLVVLVMGIGALGHFAVRFLGARTGLPASGFVSGFVSSAATVAAMGSRAQHDALLLEPAVAGAVLSTVSTVIQLAIVVVAVSPPTLAKLVVPLAFAGATSIGYGLFDARRAAVATAGGAMDRGRAVDLKAALLFASIVTSVLLLGAALQARLGETGLVVGLFFAGFADVHAAAISAASLVAGGGLAAEHAVVPILAALTANSATKAILAFGTGPRAYAVRVGIGLILVVAAAWLGFAVTR